MKYNNIKASVIYQILALLSLLYELKQKKKLFCFLAYFKYILQYQLSVYDNICK